jgi:hypothetical protein
MKNLLARFRQAGSFIAGLLIGISIMIPMFAMMVTNLDDWEMHWVLGTLIVLALGLKLQFALIKPSRPRTRAPELGAPPVILMELKFE